MKGDPDQQPWLSFDQLWILSASELEQEDLEERAFRHTRLATPAWSISTDSYEVRQPTSVTDSYSAASPDPYSEYGSRKL